MKFAIAPLIAAAFTVAALFGYNFSPEIQATVNDSAVLITNGVLALITIYLGYKGSTKSNAEKTEDAVEVAVEDAVAKADYRNAKEIKTAVAVDKAVDKYEDEHADVTRNQGGFARFETFILLALVSLFFLAAAGCASLKSGSLTPDQRAAAVLIDAKAVANTCGELYSKDRISRADASACLQYVTQAIEGANMAHFVITTGSAEEQTGVDKILTQAEEVIKILQQVIAKITAEDKPVSKGVSYKPTQPLGIPAQALGLSVHPIRAFNDFVGAAQ